MNKIILLFNTVRFLKLKQVFYQLWYRIKKVKSLGEYSCNETTVDINYQCFSDYLRNISYVDDKDSFDFLNQKVSFGESINWDFLDNGKLWNYNLHYANYILQEEVPLEKRLKWLKSLHAKLYQSNTGLEPYPVSLRLINSIRLICRHKLNDSDLLRNIQAEASFLSQRIEFHLLGNHLLENAFALLLSGAFFKEKKWISEGHYLLFEQLNEQILIDGAHFELSPMYHQIIFYRLLELIDWYSQWEDKDINTLEFYRTTAVKMLGWLKNITFRNGDIPLFSDSAYNITYRSTELFSYAESLQLSISDCKHLSDSGYRSFKNHNYECVVDIGKISVDYQPAHGHADALSFILYVKDQPVLVERGTSTYQPGAQRDLERGTLAHNTLVYKNRNQSQVWGGFRIGKRAKIELLTDTTTAIKAAHDGYKKGGGIHQREFVFKENSIEITDEFISKTEQNEGDVVVYFHVFPGLPVQIEGTEVKISENIILNCLGAHSIQQEIYRFASQYNQYSDGILIKVVMKSSLKTIIYF